MNMIPPDDDKEELDEQGNEEGSASVESNDNDPNPMGNNRDRSISNPNIVNK